MGALTAKKLARTEDRTRPLLGISWSRYRSRCRKGDEGSRRYLRATASNPRPSVVRVRLSAVTPPSAAQLNGSPRPNFGLTDTYRADDGVALHGWTLPRDTRWVQLVRWLRAPARGKPLARWRDGVFVILRPPRSLASASARCSQEMVHLVKIGSRSSHLLTSQQ